MLTAIYAVFSAAADDHLDDEEEYLMMMVAASCEVDSLICNAVSPIVLSLDCIMGSKFNFGALGSKLLK